MSEELLEALRRERIATATRQYAPGETILEEGTRKGGLFIVTLGVVGISTTYAGRKEATLRLLQKGQMFGYPFVEACAFSRVQAFMGCEVLRVATESLQYLVRRRPEVALDLVTMREADLLYQEELAGRLMHRKTEIRLASLLLDLVARFGEISKEGEQTIGLRLTHDELARMIAATREGVTNALNRWKREEVVKAKHQSTIILNAKALEDVAYEKTVASAYMDGLDIWTTSTRQEAR